METISFISLMVAIIAAINTAWTFFLALMGASGTLGAKLSKKAGTDNANTDQNIETGKSFMMAMIDKTKYRAAVAIIAYVIYLFTK